MNQRFERAIDHFIGHIRRVYGASTTATHYASDLRLFGATLDKEPREVQPADITAYADSQLAAGLSRSTVNRRLATLSHFFTYLAAEAGDEGWRNPVIWQRHRLETGHHLPRDLSEQTARQLWHSVAAGPVRDQALISLMLDVGLRAGEVIRLQTGDYRRAPDDAGLASLRVTGKGHKERQVWLTPATSQLLESYLAQRPQGPCEALFLTRRQGGFTLRGIQERVKHYARQAGLPPEQVSCHRLRHTFARRMAESGMPLPSLSQWLGHSHLQTTQVYIDGANPTLRADYETAMQALSRPAERSPQASAPAPTVPPPPSPPEAAAAGLAADEMRPGLAALPPWLQEALIAFLCSQQLRWKAQHRRARAQQWLGELRRAWTWLLAEQALAGLEQLSHTQVLAYLQHRQAQALSPHTRNHFITTLQAFLRFAEEQGAAIAPTLYHIRRPQRPVALPRPLAPDAYARLEAVALDQTQATTDEALLARAWYLVLCDTGVRISELTALTVADWDSCQRTLLIRQPKYYHDRCLPVTPRTAAALDAHLAARPPSPDADQPLLARHGRPLSAAHVRQHLHQWARAAQVADVTPHRLRHTLATRLLNSGHMPITSLQKILGHRHLDTTMGYVALYDTTVQRDYVAAMAAVQAQPLPDPDRTVWGDVVQQAFNRQAACNPDEQMSNSTQHKVNCM
jgi:integrase/recombinase XerC